MKELNVNLGNIKLTNPILTASGTCGYGIEYSDFLDLKELGAFVTKSITRMPRYGNDYPRIVETRAGMLNAIGLANVGIDVFLQEKMPILREIGVPVFVNVAGQTIDDYVAVASILNDTDVTGIELNISCPNVKEGGMHFGTDPVQVSTITSAIRKVYKKLLIVKLSPNVTDIAVTAKAAVEYGADVLSLINTFMAMAIDIEQRKPILANGSGGLSGPCIYPIALFMVRRVYTEVTKKLGIPIIAGGGIQQANDAIGMLLAGATCLSVGTAMFVDPMCIIAIKQGILAYLKRHNFANIGQIVGAMQE